MLTASSQILTYILYAPVSLLLATILISLPVQGFLSFLAFRSDTENAPKTDEGYLFAFAQCFVATVCDTLNSAASFAASSVLVFTLIGREKHP